MADRVDVGEIELAYERRGEGPVVAFAHGLGGGKEGWADVAQRVADAGFETICVDMRGAGESEVPPGPYSVEAWAADLVALLDALGIEHAALVGHSVGCMVVEHAALALEGRCPALAMLGGAIRWGDGFETVLGERAELARAGSLGEVAVAVAAAGFSQRAHAERPELIESFVEDFASQDPEGYAESALATARASMLDPERIGCPSLALAGAEDAVTPTESSQEIAETMPRGEFAAVSGGAHWCHIELPERVGEQLAGFLGRSGFG